MRHIEIRDLWLQQEVAQGSVIVEKVPGERDPADLRTKILSIPQIAIRLGLLSIEFESTVNMPTATGKVVTTLLAMISRLLPLEPMGEIDEPFTTMSAMIMLVSATCTAPRS